MVCFSKLDVFFEDAHQVELEFFSGRGGQSAVPEYRNIIVQFTADKLIFKNPKNHMNSNGAIDITVLLF